MNKYINIALVALLMVACQPEHFRTVYHVLSL